MAFERKQKGVTLVEVMVVIAVIGIGTSIMLVSMGNAREQKRVETAAREMAAMFREAQGNALAGKLYKKPATGEEVSVCGYGISWNVSSLNRIGFARREKDVSGGCSHANWTTDSFKTFQNIRVSNQKGASLPLSRWIFGYDLPHATVNKSFFRSDPFTANGNLGVLVSSTVDSSISYTVCAFANGKVSEHQGSVNCDSL